MKLTMHLKKDNIFLPILKRILLYGFDRKELAAAGNLIQGKCKKIAIIGYDKWFNSVNGFSDSTNTLLRRRNIK